MSGKEIFVSRGGIMATPVEEWIQFEAFFSKAERFQGQEVLISTFKENTIAESWKLKGEELCRGSFTFFNLYGRAQKGENSPIMVLRDTALEIFENEDSLNKHENDLYFRNDGGRIHFKLRHGSYFELTSEYDRWLVKIIAEVVSKIEQKSNS